MFRFHDEMPKSTAFQRSGMYGNTMPAASVRTNNSRDMYDDRSVDPSDPGSGQAGPNTSLSD